MVSVLRLFIGLALVAPAVAKAQGQPMGTVNFDPRPLNSHDVARFLPLVCQGAVPASGGYNCQAMTGYPGYEATPAAGTLYNFTPTSIVYGHLTDAVSTQAYISYTADFEPHSDNFGGGIIFQAGWSGWGLVRWVPGVSLDNCVQLEPSGKARMLCWFFYVGQGEADSSLTLVTVPTQLSPNGDYSAFLRDVISGQDLSRTDDDNLACGKVKNPNQYLLTGIDDLARSSAPGAVATAKIHYIEPAAVTKFCAKQDLIDAPVTTGTLNITWRNGKIGFSPNYSYAPPF